MSLNRYNPKRDDAERDILRALEEVGCRWIVLDVFDILVWRPGTTNLYALEVKSPGSERRLTDRQRVLIEGGWPIHVCSTPYEALKAVGL